MPTTSNLAQTMATEHAIPPALVAQLEAEHGQLGTVVRRGLATVFEILADTSVRIVFAGHFSCGKSSVLNMLIGRPLLPTGDLPETGVPCELQSGRRDAAIAMSGSGTTELRLSTEAIAHRVSLIGADGDTRAAVREVERIMITLARGPIPLGASWIDSPGINDPSDSSEPVVTQRAEQEAARADVLVWVVNARQPLSEVEQQFLRTYVRHQHHRQVVFLINAFLPEPSERGWHYFTEKIAPACRLRVMSLALNDSWAPVMVEVSAQAAAADPHAFGGPQAIGLLSALSSVRHPRVQVSKLHKASRALAHLVAEVTRYREALRETIAAAHAEAAKLTVERDAQRKEFERHVQQSIGLHFAYHRDAAQACGAAVSSEIVRDNLQRDGSYTRSLTARMTQVGYQLGTEILNAVNAACLTYRQSTLSPDGQTRLRGLLQPQVYEIAVPSTPVKGAGAGAVIGGIIGTVLFPGLGTAIGAAVGGGLGSAAGSSSATGSDSAQAHANALTAGQASAAYLLGRQHQVIGLVLAECFPLRQLPAVPDGSKAHSVDRLLERLHTLAAHCRDLAGSLPMEAGS